MRRLSHEIDATPEMIGEALFGEAPRVFCDIAEHRGEPSGFALWFYSFSTFRGRYGIYLEDLYVRPAGPGHGLGKALLANLAKRCVAENLRAARVVGSRLERAVDRLLQAQGAETLDDWTTCRVTGEALWRLADQAR